MLAIVAPHGQREARLLRWGLVPPSSKTLRGEYSMFNARMETVASKPAYRTLIPHASHRALQIGDKWLEWLPVEKRGQPRQPFLFQADGGQQFAFAALWTSAEIEGDHIDSVVMLTRPAAPNPIAAAIQDRMPVVFADRDAEQAWLGPALDAEDALALCGPFPEERLSATPANPAINRAGAAPEGPQLLAAPEHTGG